MKLAILTPLFPPDTDTPSVYAKLLATQLKELKPTVVAYGSFPESVNGVIIHPIDKRGSKIKLIYKSLKTLLDTAPTTLIVLNGPSSDMPALFFSYLTKVPIVYVYSDAQAKKRYSPLTRYFSQWLARRAVSTIALPESTETFILPEQLPFKTADESHIRSILTWWKTHEENIIKYVK